MAAGIRGVKSCGAPLSSLSQSKLRGVQAGKCGVQGSATAPAAAGVCRGRAAESKAIAFLNAPTNEEKRTHGMDYIDGGRERLTEHLHRLGIENDVPGASVAVLAGGEVVEATFGVVSTPRSRQCG
jgi:hypothetical protein